MIINLYYIADIAIALAFPIFFYINHRTGRFQPRVWKLYWIGCLIGLTWEVPMFLSGPEFQSEPFIYLVNDFPLHPVMHPFLHTLWDGGLFLIGYWLTLQLCKSPILQRFRWQELGIMILWGQLSELAVEVSATSVGAWTFAEKPYNPALFSIGDRFVTVIPQAIWLLAPIVFYFIALTLARAQRAATAPEALVTRA